MDRVPYVQERPGTDTPTPASRNMYEDGTEESGEASRTCPTSAILNPTMLICVHVSSGLREAYSDMPAVSSDGQSFLPSHRRETAQSPQDMN